MSINSAAYWMFIIQGDIEEAERDITDYLVPPGVALTINIPDPDTLIVNAEDHELGGRTTMPYPNQLHFLDYLTGTEGYQLARYFFHAEGVAKNIPTDRWTLDAYLAEKRR